MGPGRATKFLGVEECDHSITPGDWDKPLKLWGTLWQWPIIPSHLPQTNTLSIPEGALHAERLVNPKVLAPKKVPKKCLGINVFSKINLINSMNISGFATFPSKKEKGRLAYQTKLTGPPLIKPLIQKPKFYCLKWLMAVFWIKFTE
jgi:hypothetical protein